MNDDNEGVGSRITFFDYKMMEKLTLIYLGREPLSLARKGSFQPKNNLGW
jgi:hypothetical protein